MSSSPNKSAPKEIKRVPMACKNCRTRKLKCRPYDKAQGAGDCERCVEQAIICVYEPIQKSSETSSPPNFIQSIVPATHPHLPQPSAASPSMSPTTPEHPHGAQFYSQSNIPPANWNQHHNQGAFGVGPGSHQPQLQYANQQPLLAGTYQQQQQSYVLPSQHNPPAQYLPAASQHPQQHPQHPIQQHTVPVMSYPNHMNQQQQIPMAGQTPYMTYPPHAGPSTQQTMMNPLAGGTYGYSAVPHSTHPFGANAMPSGVPAYTTSPVLHQPNPSYHQDSSLAQWQYQATDGSGNDRNEG